MKNKDCDGYCSKTGDCKGVVQKVEVFERGGHTWGKFNYCMTAIDEDRKNGYSVKIISDEKK